ncbi:MAG: hypothetical protein C5B50_14245 [Verrucomicrobia bacterium]|nr:MAG: hypothetical protein C5B50_14245 [Verrucomicrobiota bacterium]
MTAIGLWFFLPTAGLSQPYSFTTLAGSAGTIGSTDGTGTNALFDLPSGVAVDSAGNVYVADTFNSTIRKITTARAVSTLAGQAGVQGSDDGTTTNALFAYPHDVAVDSAGNLYVGDSGNQTIRKVTPAGVVTTLAGFAGLAGSANGTGTNAQFYGPTGVAVDGAGNVYVADTDNSTIRKVTPTGAVSTLAGLAGSFGSADGSSNNARFYYPFGVALDGATNVYVADTLNNTIRKITPAGVVSTLAGQAGISGSVDGTGTNALFNNPSGLVMDSATNLYVADKYNNTIRKITPAGLVSTLAGQAGIFGSSDGAGTNALFYYPSSVAVDAAANLYVADAYNYTIRLGRFEPLQITPAQAAVSTGPSGGFFSTSNQVFTVTNVGTGSLNWSMANTSVWLSASLSNGTLAPSKSTNTTVSLNSAAFALAPGTYTANLAFTNLLSGTVQIRQFTLQAIEALQLTPTQAVVSTGLSGGPFSISNQIFTATNLSAASVHWAVANTSSWLNASPAGGTLASIASTNVSASLNSAANALSPGSYTANLLFTNLQDSRVQSRQFTLQVAQVGTLSAARLTNGALQISLTNFSGLSFTLVAATNVLLPRSNWTVLGHLTETPPGHYQFTDFQSTNIARRFYRAKSP